MTKPLAKEIAKDSTLKKYYYPAMYENVISSGSNDCVGYKNEDYLYSSSNIVILPKFKQYKGNSFLSIVTMVDYMKGK